MKKVTIILISFMSIFSIVQAQTLYTDEKDILVFCKIQKTNKTTSCKGSINSDKKINIWKVTLGIENGYSKSIVPRGVGIADISVYPNPIKPYSHEYCNYKYVKNYEPNSTQRHLDQSLYVWPIIDYKIEEIRPGESITNTTYLYLYEGQQPKLTNWEFLGYRLKDDFDADGDPILVDIKADTTTLVPKVTVIRGDKLKEQDEIVVVPKDLDSIKIVSVNETAINSTKNNELTIEKEVKLIEEKTSQPEPINVTDNEKVSEEINIQKPPTDALGDAKITINEKVLIESDKEPELKNTTIDKLVKVVDNCPGEKSLEYRKMSDTSSDKEEQKAYSWLALYYSYVCECEFGSQDSHQLVAVINNVVDSFMSNTKGKYGEIPKVKKCKAPIEK